jgi:DNA repair photolyase
MVEALPDRPRKGRGAISNRSGRYERESRLATDDGWPGDDAELAPLRTTITADRSRSVIARNTSPDVPFDRSINPYRGCEHGCVYCFARPSHAYLGLSPGLDFETKILAKQDAAELLRAALAKPGYRATTLALGANTDPYQPIERRLGITRSVLEVLAETNHPVGIVTKSDLVLRDLDLLAAMARRRLVRVSLSVTTLDRALARKMEPRASSPQKRLAAMRELARAGVPVSVLVAPVVPAINDGEIEAILAAAAEAGADSASYLLLRLPLEIGPLFEEWLEVHYPERKGRALALIRASRGGKLYDSTWGLRMTGTGAYAKMIGDRFALGCRRLDLTRRAWNLDSGQFKAPEAWRRQLALF